MLLIVLTIVGALMPSAARQLSHARVNRAARVMAADFMLAQSTAARQRQPVFIQVDTAAKTVTIVDEGSGSQIQVRHFGPDSEFKLATLGATVTTLMVRPNGMTSGAMTATLSSSGHTRQVRITRAGFVRVL